MAKPYGQSFQAMVKAQRQNGALPDKLTEMVVPSQAAQATGKPHLFAPTDNIASQEGPSTREQITISASEHRASQAGSAHIATGTTTPRSFTQGSFTQGSSTQLSTPASPASHVFAMPAPTTPASTAQASTTHVDPSALIPRNVSGQRVDPRVDAFGWLVKDARPRNLCFEHHLHGRCTWPPTSCPRVHSRSMLHIHQINALQVLAREVPCTQGNACPNWKCCYGHRCPFGERCNRGASCRFSRGMHITDLRVVDL